MTSPSTNFSSPRDFGSPMYKSHRSLAILQLGASRVAVYPGAFVFIILMLCLWPVLLQVVSLLCSSCSLQPLELPACMSRHRGGEGAPRTCHLPRFTTFHRQTGRWIKTSESDKLTGKPHHVQRLSPMQSLAAGDHATVAADTGGFPRLHHLQEHLGPWTSAIW